MPLQRRSVNLYDILPDAEINYTDYHRSENEVSTSLILAGYSLEGAWFTGDRDSFGPLTRCIFAADPDNNPVIIVYG